MSVGQVGAFETIALVRKSPMESMRAWRSSGATNDRPRRARIELGIISQLVNHPNVCRHEAQALAETIARNPSDALRRAKQMLWHVLEA